MKKFSKLIALVLSVAMCLSFVSCGDKTLSDNIRVGSLVGPTGMGLIDLVDNEKIDLEMYENPTDVVQKLVAGELDVACVPSNMGGVLYNKTEGNIRILSTIVNGVLYLVENGSDLTSIKDLKGRTIVASGKGGTPEYVLDAVLENAGLVVGEDVQVEWVDSHATVAQKVANMKGAIGLLPEPMVSSIILKTRTVRIALNMNSLWQDMTGQELPMGILIAKKDFVEQRADDVAIFLDDVKASIEDVKTNSDEVVAKIVDAGIIASKDVCKAVIPNCSLVCASADETKAGISTLYDILFKIEPMSIGGKLPGDDIYWGRS